MAEEDLEAAAQEEAAQEELVVDAGELATAKRPAQAALIAPPPTPSVRTPQPRQNFFDRFDGDQEASRPADKPNHFDQYDKDDDAAQPGLLERARLNAMDAFYRGTIVGSDRTRLLREVLDNPEGVHAKTSGIDPKTAREEYESIISNLSRYDMTKPWDSTTEAAVAFGGQLGGSLPSPESLIGLPIRGATWFWRIIKSGAIAGGVNVATDPIVQVLSQKGGTQQ